MADVNQRTFVLAIGIDSADDDLFRYTFHCASPSGEGSDIQSNKMIYVNYSVTSPSLILAIRELTVNSDHRASFEHLKILSLGSEYIEKYALDDLDSLFRVANVHRKCTVVVSDGAADNLLVSSENEDSTAVLSSLLDRYGTNDAQCGRDFSLQELFIKRQDNLSFYLPLISVMSNSDIDISVTETNGKKSDNVFFLDGLCSFVSGHYKGKLGAPELESVRMLNYGKSNEIIEVKSSDGMSFFYHIVSSDCKRKCRIENNTPHFFLSLSVTCELSDSSGASSDSINEHDIEAALKERIERLVYYSKNGYGSEILGLETELRQSHHIWFCDNRDNIDDIYRDCPVDINVDCTIMSRGYID